MRRTHARWRIAPLIAVVAALAAGCAGHEVVAMGTIRGPEVALRGRLDGGVPTAAWTAADPLGSEVALFRSPGEPLVDDDGVPVVLANPTFEHVPLALRVLQRQGDWVRVQYPERPNGVTAWARVDQLRLRPVEHRIEIHRSSAEVIVYRGADKVAVYPAAVGAQSSPTPLGTFYVDARVVLADASGPYGAGQVSVTGFSEVYDTFGAGRGQIAIHGTNQIDVIGSPVSHGCVRIANDDLLELVHLVPTGTPVDIVA